MKALNLTLRTIVLTFALVSTAISALAHDFEVDGIYYRKYNSSSVYVTYRGTSSSEYNYEYNGNVTIPSTVTYSGVTYTVKYIDSQAFQGCTGLTGITIPNSVTIINWGAFYGCTSLTSVTIPNSVTSINGYAFYGCTNLATVTLGSSVASINDYAFSNCSKLTNIAIPKSVTTIGNEVFRGCSSLTAINVDANNTKYSSTNGILFNKSKNELIIFPPSHSYTTYTIPNTVTAISGSAFYGCTRLTNVAIPNTVTAIGTWAFCGCSGLTSITIPNTVNAIDDGVFYGCNNLQSVTIPNSIYVIGSEAFENCSSLTSVTIPSSVISIGSYAFYNCSALTSVTCEATTPPTMASSSVFNNYTKPTLYVPAASLSAYQTTNYWNKFTHISAIQYPTAPPVITYQTTEDAVIVTATGNGTVILKRNGSTVSNPCTILRGATDVTSTFTATAQAQNQLISEEVTQSITIPQLATFNYNGLRYVKAENGTTVTVTYQDYNTSNNYPNIESLTIPSTISKNGLTMKVIGIGEYAFARSPWLTNVSIPSSITSIGNYAFYYCPSLTTVNIGSGVTSVGNRAFYGSNALTSVTCEALTPPSMQNSYTFSNYTTPTLYVHYASLNAYQTTNYWNKFTHISTIEPPTTPPVISYETNDDAVIVSATSSDNSTVVMKVNGTVVENPYTILRGVTDVNITVTATAQKNGQLVSEEVSQQITVPQLTYFTVSGFRFVKAENTANVDVTYQVYNSANNYQGMTSAVIPSTVSKNGINFNVVGIGAFAFAKCATLASVSMPTSIRTIGNNSFQGCTALSGIIIPNSVSSIGNNTFYGCSKLSSLKLPNNIAGIGSYTFYGCTSLTTLTIPASVTSIGNKAFNQCNALNSITCEALTPPAMASDAVFSDYTKPTLYVHHSSLNAYKTTSYWNLFTHIVSIEPVTDAPVISYQTTSESVIITASGNGTVIMKVNGVQVENPYTIPRGDEDQTVTVTATAQKTGEIVSETTTMVITIPAFVVEPPEYDANNYLWMRDTTALHGDIIVIPIAMTNEASITAVQTDIYLPTGLELMQDEDGYIITPSGRVTNSHVIMSNQVSTGAIRLLCYSTSEKAFNGSDGELFYLTVRVADNAEGDYTIALRNTLLTTTAATDLYARDTTANVHVNAYMLGDANDSHSVTVTDIVTTAKYILEMNPQPFIFAASDVNMDGTISGSDLVLIANMIVAGTPHSAPHRMPSHDIYSDRLCGENINLMSGESRRMSITLDNVLDYTAFQFDLQLPEGLEANNFQLTDRASGHAFDVNTLSEGKMRVLCYSPALRAIEGSDGALLTFDVTAAGELNGDITVDGIEFVTTDGQPVYLDAFTIGVNATTSVNNLYSTCRIFGQGYNIIIETQMDTTVTISDIAGRSQLFKVRAGRTVIPMGNAGVYIVTASNQTVKLMLK